MAPTFPTTSDVSVRNVLPNRSPACHLSRSTPRKKRSLRRRIHLMALAPLFRSCALVVLFAAAASNLVAQELRYGPEQALGEGTIRTYLIVDQEGRPAELGVAISEVAMATLPDLSDKPPMESFIAMDLEIPEGSPAPYRLVGFDWNSIGHPPVDIYGVPHFDFHFYTIDAAAKGTILP